MSNETERRRGFLEAYDFKIQTRKAFENEAPINHILRAKQYPGALVLWDPCDDEQGFMLCGNDADALRSAWHEHFPEL